MLNDLLELTTTLVHSSHEPRISSITGPAMPPRSRHAKSSSVGSSSSTADVNGILADSPGFKAPAPAGTATRRRRQSRGAAATPGSPVVLVPKPLVRNEPSIIAETRKFEPLKFATTVLLSFFLEAGLHTIASNVGVGDLAAVSRRHDSWTEVLPFLGWKIFKLGIYWGSDFDGTF